MFHSLLVHGSGPNKSPNPRNTALYAFFSPQVTYKPGPGDPPRKTFRVIAGMGGKKEHEFIAQPSS
jgi:ectoine hydroxylase-related dioxygenase (phytanoyl-CoA dioxygenase family)